MRASECCRVISDGTRTMHDDHDEFGGLHRDLGLTGVAMGRRQLLRFGLGAGALYLLGCGNSTGTDDDDDGSNAACSVIPEETAGPFPGDGSNGPSVLNQTGVVRGDIRSSFAGLSGTADGIPLSIVLTIVSVSGACAPLSGRAVYLWHCDKLGRYSLYSSGATNQNYLRGVQETDASGKVTFTSIFPACYSGLAAHSLRGVSESGRGDERVEQNQNVAARISQGTVRLGVRDRDVHRERREFEPSELGNGQRVQRWRRERARDRHWQRCERLLGGTDYWCLTSKRPNDFTSSGPKAGTQMHADCYADERR